MLVTPVRGVIVTGFYAGVLVYINVTTIFVNLLKDTSISVIMVTTEKENFMRNRTNNKSGALTKILLVVALLVMSGAVILYSVYFQPSDETIQPTPSTPPPPTVENMDSGAVPSSDNATVDSDEAMGDDLLLYSLNSTPELEGNTLHISYKNPITSGKVVGLEIVTDTGELLCRTGYIPPGYELPTVELLRELSVGEHTLRVDIYLFELDSLESRGYVFSDIAVTVLPPEE